MSSKHLFAQERPYRNSLVIHVARPGGKNAVGIAWSDILEYAGISKKTTLQPSGSVTEMIDSGEVDEFDDPIMIPETTEVVGVGQISDAEAAQILAGELLEVSGIVKLSGSPSTAELNKLAVRMYDDWQSKMIQQHQYCGHTQG